MGASAAGLLLLAIGTGCRAARADADGKGGSSLEGRIQIDGSSTVYPLSEGIAVAFRKQHPHVNVTVGISGTGGGFKRFSAGATDISDASRPIKDSEFAICRANQIEFIEIPVAYDGLSIVVHPKNDFIKELTIDQLKRIFLAGGARTWNELDDAWPQAEIKIFAPGDDSGTYDYFFGDVVNQDGGGDPRSQGVSFNEDDNALVAGVSRELHSIGFFGCSYYFENKNLVKAVPIVDPQTGKAVLPRPETIESGEYAPFSRPLFIYVNVESLRSPAMKKFVEFYLDNAPDAAHKVRYVPLSEDIYESAYSHYEHRLTGTHFLTPELHKRIGPLAETYQEENLVRAAQE